MARNNGNGDTQVNYEIDDNQTPQAPIQHIRAESITASIWERPGQYGPLHSVRLQRTYRDADDKLQNTDYLPKNQLLAAAEALVAAWRFCQSRTNKARAGGQPQPEPQAQPQPRPRPRPQSPDADLVPILLPSGKTVRVTPEVADYISLVEEREENLARAA